ncbi:MAG: Gfo/Idh/MocA family oxidoreductase [Planctomycetia bacterium]|nr:Gfo/Idh/MocA family oxidoreductase [Planctomycetia bacterium]
MEEKRSGVSRRSFLKTGSVLAAAGFFAGAPRVHAAENNTIKLALIGCGNRGSGAIRQALAADPNTKLYAVADAFQDKADAIVNALTEVEEEGRVDVPAERRFIGLAGYRDAIDSLDPGDVVILATDQVFRALHFEYAVQKGLNVFAEKPLAVDVPNLKRIQAANKIALEKNLKVSVGLNNRHYLRTEETIAAIHDGVMGDITSCWVYRSQDPHNLKPKGDYTELQHQIRNIFCFDWTSGGFIVDALIHNIDISCWAKGAWPIAAQGVGGRISRKVKDQLIEFASVEYLFPDSTKLMLQTRTMPNVWHYFASNIIGTKGCSQVGEGVGDPRIYAGNDMNSDNRKVIWEPTKGGNDSYQEEHNRLFAAIREDKQWNEIERSVQATFVGILGRMAQQTGQRLTAEQGWTSTFEYVPNIDQLSIDDDSPCMPDENGNYFIPVPGEFQFS